jgi:hypothetical protein
LTYIIRKVVDPPDEATDIAFSIGGSRLGSPRDVEERAPHGNPEYQVNNARVFEMLNDAIGYHKNIKTWIKAYARTKDGRAAWEAFKKHFHGTNQMEAIEASTEKQVATLVYRGEKPRYNFETHLSKHLRAHLDIDKAGGLLNERQKVRKFVESFQVLFLNPATAQVHANNDYLESFDQTVSYLSITFIIQKDQVKICNVFSVQGKSKGKKRVSFDNKKKDMEERVTTGTATSGRVSWVWMMKIVFNKKEEWFALSKDKHSRIAKVRKSCVA